MKAGSDQRKFNTVMEAIDDLREGKMVILIDDEDRENEGDLMIAAEKVTPEAVNFMAKEGRGLICLSLTPARCDELNLPLMVKDNTSAFGTGFTVSIEAKQGVTTGISAADRCTTIKTAIDPATGPADLARPGHVFPLRAREGGVLVRIGQTEGSVDLCKIAGLYPAAVICEVMKDDGTMARVPDLLKLSEQRKIKMVTVKDVVEFRLKTEHFVRRSAETKIPTKHGVFKTICYENSINKDVHLAMVYGDISGDEPCLTRVHSQCLTGDVFGSQRCDCGEQLDHAMEMIAEQGRGVILYLSQEGRGIGLVNKLKAYELQDEGKDTVEANKSLGFKPDLRDYGLGAQILIDLGIHKIRLLTNNPRKIVGLDGYNMEIVERVPIICEPGENNLRYLSAKQNKLGHMLGIKKKQ
ncbi:MAG TPA: bifunctional 3,4-dihydroxy-2-butanone-4-phosphate synthase/GTP cyclohydrolase II [Nitrospirae bacterium]|nr:bifunctional 3,4-dihydroxy-2-butanone-4-phosphate synthase/GTP cyclohydrolase II [Nitrospirota bacterium]